jgi:hypothetical protein
VGSPTLSVILPGSHEMYRRSNIKIREREILNEY